MQPKSLYISLAVSNFYGTEIKIWAGFVFVGNNNKKDWTDYEQLLKAVFSCSIRTKMSNKIEVKKT